MSNERPRKYSVIDIETTGGSARANKITEIAVINMDGAQIVERFSSLVFPERSIPPQIQYLTGITDDMVAGAPKFYELAKKIVELTEGRIFVAHNVHFDYNFIQHEFRELGYQFKKELLCTVRLARKILPGHPSYSLGKLCERLDIPLTNRHRAMGDAKATAKLFQTLQESKSERFEEVFRGLNGKINFPPRFNEQDYERLPKSPGIYYLLDKNGELLYIGKAKDIKKRVRQHFEVKSSRTKEYAFKNNIAAVSFEETGNELAALLLEAHEIKTRSPLFNRALRRKRFPWAVVKFHNERGAVCFRAAKSSETDPDIRCGSRRIAESTIRKIYHKAFGVDPDMELARSSELETLFRILGAEEYNKRLEQKLASLSYPRESFQIKLRGRRQGETCYVRRLREEGLAVIYEDQEGASERFELTDTPDAARIILHYLRKNEIKLETL